MRWCCTVVECIVIIIIIIIIISVHWTSVGESEWVGGWFSLAPIYYTLTSVLSLLFSSLLLLYYSTLLSLSLSLTSSLPFNKHESAVVGPSVTSMCRMCATCQDGFCWQQSKDTTSIAIAIVTVLFIINFSYLYLYTIQHNVIIINVTIIIIIILNPITKYSNHIITLINNNNNKNKITATHI